MDDNTKPEEKVEPWPLVWTKYWNPLPDDEIRKWDDELAATFGRDDKGVERVTEAEVSDAVRQLGGRDEFQKYRPKLGAIIQIIKQKHASQERAESAAPARRGTIDCPYCNDTAWVGVKYNVVVIGGLKKKELPRIGKHIRHHPDDPSLMIEYLGFENTDFEMSLPCTICGKGSKYVGEGLLGSTSRFMEKFKAWLNKLPDECIDKPGALRRTRVDLIRTRQATPEEMGKATPIVQHDTTEEEWL